MSHAAAIRRVLNWPIAYFNAEQEAQAQAALDALLAENQRLRDALEGWLLFVLEYVADPEASAHIAANEELAVLTVERTPSATQTLEDVSPDGAAE
jgi:hypothetical protein